MQWKRLGLVLLVVLAGCGGHGDAPVSREVKAAGLRFTADVPAADQQWILAAIEKARPEARSLIDDVDGMVVVSTFSDPGGRAVGMMRETGSQAYEVTFNVAYLDADRKIDRDSTVIHELGHVIDAALVPDDLRDQLAGELPTVGGCRMAERNDCTSPPERFADTFAKWALRGAVSTVGAGYGVATPASLEDWGAPLAQLSIRIDVAAGR